MIDTITIAVCKVGSGVKSAHLHSIVLTEASRVLKVITSHDKYMLIYILAFHTITFERKDSLKIHELKS